MKNRIRDVAKGIPSLAGCAPLEDRQPVVDSKGSRESEGEGETRCVHPHVGILSSLGKEGNLPPATIWMDPDVPVRGARSRTQKDTSRVTPLTGGPQRSPVHRDREQMVGARGGAGTGSQCFMGTESQLGDMESSGDEWWGQLHSSVNSNATEL